MPEIQQKRFDNGLTLVAEPVAGARSLSVGLMTPAGLAAQPVGQLGVASVLAEMVTRGAGGKDARTHSDELDRLGVQRDSGVSGRHLYVTASLIGENAGEAMPLLVDMLRRPNLEEGALEPSRALALQAIEGLEDEHQQRVMVRLRGEHFPEPLNRSSYGEAEDIKALTLDCVRAFYAKRCVGEGAIVGVAGDYEWDALTEQIGELMGDWVGKAKDVEVKDTPVRAYHHHTADTTQVHIGLAYDAPPATADEAVTQRLAAAVLSGGMSGRLFTEVREKRGLCYSVGVRYADQREVGAVLGYAGTTVARAQETLDVFVGELRRMSEGVSESEFDRAKVGLKSRLVMQGESTGARASAIAGDVYTFGEPRSLQARAAEIDGVTREGLNDYLAGHPVGGMTVLTIGPEALTPPAVSEAVGAGV